MLRGPRLVHEVNETFLDCDRTRVAGWYHHVGKPPAFDVRGLVWRYQSSSFLSRGDQYIKRVERYRQSFPYSFNKGFLASPTRKEGVLSDVIRLVSDEGALLWSEKRIHDSGELQWADPFDIRPNMLAA